MRHRFLHHVRRIRHRYFMFERFVECIRVDGCVGRRRTRVNANNEEILNKLFVCGLRTSFSI